jgi:hypothetical protein
MLRTIPALLIFVTTVSAVFAAPTVRWSEKGWYQVEEVVFDGKAEDGWLIGGPFKTKDACEAKWPARDNAFERSCRYLESKPSWD